MNRKDVRIELNRENGFTAYNKATGELIADISIDEFDIEEAITDVEDAYIYLEANEIIEKSE